MHRQYIDYVSNNIKKLYFSHEDDRTIREPSMSLNFSSILFLLLKKRDFSKHLRVYR